jgi:hypothetical protein
MVKKSQAHQAKPARDSEFLPPCRLNLSWHGRSDVGRCRRLEPENRTRQ